MNGMNFHPFKSLGSAVLGTEDNTKQRCFSNPIPAKNRPSSKIQLSRGTCCGSLEPARVRRSSAVRNTAKKSVVATSLPPRQ